MEVPYVDLVGDGIKTIFSYTFGIVETFDLLVLVDTVLQIENSAYTIENLTDAGGDIVFATAPDDGDRVLILRKTTITQNVDYEPFSAFPSETHEFNLDKITYILQELLGGAFGGKDSDGNDIILSFDLSVTAGVTTVTINNTGGTDAVIEPWVSGETAGVFLGELTLSAPADESVTTEPDGKMWIEHT